VRQRRPELPAALAFKLSDLRLAERQTRDREPLDLFMAALRRAGWTLDSIADELDLTRERVRQRTARVPEDTELPAVPAVPQKREKPREARRPRIRPEAAALMYELARAGTLARAAARPTPANIEARAASRQLTRMMCELHSQGITPTAIANASGLTHNAVRIRLGRAGRITLPPSLLHLVGAPTYARERGPSTGSDWCARGHPMIGDNLRIVAGNGPSAGVRVCRACERRRCDAYRARSKAARSVHGRGDVAGASA
jgi:hypothetical protein